MRNQHSTRINLRWPDDLDDAVREKVKRGETRSITQYFIDAVKEKLEREKQATL